MYFILSVKPGMDNLLLENIGKVNFTNLEVVPMRYWSLSDIPKSIPKLEKGGTYKLSKGWMILGTGSRLPATT